MLEHSHYAGLLRSSSLTLSTRVQGISSAGHWYCCSQWSTLCRTRLPPSRRMEHVIPSSGLGRTRTSAASLLSASWSKLLLRAASQSSSAQTFACPKLSRVCASKDWLYNRKQACRNWPSTFPKIIVCEEKIKLVSDWILTFSKPDSVSSWQNSGVYPLRL